MSGTNLKFAEATTSIAFALMLSKRQCNTLLRLTDPAHTEHERLWVVQVDGLRSLEGKGLVFWHQDETGKATGFGGVTSAGLLVADLLREAGMSIEATDTPLITKRIERYGEHARKVG